MNTVTYGPTCCREREALGAVFMADEEDEDEDSETVE